MTSPPTPSRDGSESETRHQPIDGTTDASQSSPSEDDLWQLDGQAVDAFMGRCLEILNDGAIALLMSVGHQTRLFDLLAERPGTTSRQLADVGSLDERYVREWLDGMVVAGVVDYDAVSTTYRLPRAHAAVLTTAAGPENMAQQMQDIAMLGEVEQKIIQHFHHGGGLSYADYPRFHQTMAETSAAVLDASLIDEILPLVPELSSRLTAGIDVADIGCGSGHAINLMARAYPASSFTDFDFSAPAIDAARDEARRWGLSNAWFELADVAQLDVDGSFDVVTAFDAIHDQAHPGMVLENIHRGLRPGGVFLMVDIRASSNVEDNIGLPWGSYLYAMSMFHCMSVSLGLGGDGLGTVWGRQLAVRMLAEAGFGPVEVRDVKTDPVNSYYIAQRA